MRVVVATARRLSRSVKFAAAIALLMSGLGTLALSVVTAAPAAAAQAVTCIDPAGASTTTVTTTWANGEASNYNVECEEETGISGTSAYPTINIASGAANLPANATFGGAATSSTCGVGSGATTTTSSSGTTEQYITICAMSGTPATSQSPNAALQIHGHARGVRGQHPEPSYFRDPRCQLPEPHSAYLYRPRDRRDHHHILRRDHQLLLLGHMR